MDLSLPLLGVLGLVGYNLNIVTDPREYINKRTNIPSSEIPNGKNIYDGGRYDTVKQEEKDRLDNLYKNSIRNTNNYAVSMNSKPKELKRVKFADLEQEQQTIELAPTTKIYNGPMFSVSKYFIPQDISSDFVAKEDFSNISELSGKQTNFEHNNMVPFFGSNVKQNNKDIGKLQRYSGADKPNKQEVIATQNGKQNIYGSQAFTNAVDPSRFMTSTIENNVLPFEQMKVAPIPQELTRQLPKGVDDLRITNQPKGEYAGRINQGSGNYVGPERIEAPKNKNERYYKNSSERYFTTANKDRLGTYSIGDNTDLRYSKKIDTMETEFHTMGAFDKLGGQVIQMVNKDDGSGTYHQKDKRSNFKNDWVRNAGNKISHRSSKEQDNIKLRKQERESSSRMDLSNAFSRIGNVVNSVDKPKTTNKELTTYSYTGSANSQGPSLPENRDSYYNTEFKTKVFSEYTPGALKKFAPQNGGSQSVNTTSSNNKTVENYIGNAKMNILTSREKTSIGTVSGSKFSTVEHDFSDRILRN